MLFKNRQDAAKKLVQRLMKYKNDHNAMVLGLPRGGVAVAAPIAKELGLPLDILVARKLGVPWEPELAFGAIAEDGQTFLNNDLIAELNITHEKIEEVMSKEKQEAARRASVYRKGKSRLDLTEKTIILVDDGIATGATMLAAIASARAQKVQKIIVAVPVMPADIKQKLKKVTDELICLETPTYFPGISAFYEKFDQLNDDDVLRVLST